MLARYFGKNNAATASGKPGVRSNSASLLDLMEDPNGAGQSQYTHPREAGVPSQAPMKTKNKSGSLLNVIGATHEQNLTHARGEPTAEGLTSGANVNLSSDHTVSSGNASAQAQLDFLDDELGALKKRMQRTRNEMGGSADHNSESHENERVSARHTDDNNQHATAARQESTLRYKANTTQVPPAYHHAVSGGGTNNPFTFDRTIAALLRCWKIAGVFAVLGFIAAALYAVSLANKYQSIAEILIEPRELRVLNDTVRPNGLNSEATVAYAESQVRLITSSSVIDPVIEELELTEDPEFTGDDKNHGLIGRIINIFSSSSADSGKKIGDVKEYLYENLFVSRINQTFIIQLGVTTKDPAKSARIANAIANSYMADESGARSSAARNASSDLAGRLDELREQVRESEDKVERYKADNGLVDAGGRLVSEIQLSRLNEQLTLAQVQSGDARTRAKLASQVDLGDVISGSLPSALVSTNISQLRLEYTRAKRRLDRLATRLGQRHPDRIAAKAEQDSALAAIGLEIKRIVQTAQEDLKRAEARETDLVAKVNELKASAVTDSAAKVRLRELNREVEANRRIFESFLLRSRETSEQENISSNSARLVTEAVPAEKTGPNRKIVVAIGTMIGGALGAILGLVPFFVGGLRQVVNGGPSSQGPSSRGASEAFVQPAASAPVVNTLQGDLYSSNDAPVYHPASVAERSSQAPSHPQTFQEHAAQSATVPIRSEPPRPADVSHVTPSGPHEPAAGVAAPVQQQAVHPSSPPQMVYSTAAPAPIMQPAPTPVYGTQMPLPGFAPVAAAPSMAQPVYVQAAPPMVPQHAVQPGHAAGPQMIYTNWQSAEQK